MDDTGSTHTPPQLPPPGWFPDPVAPGHLRFWDGRAWEDGFGLWVWLASIVLVAVASGLAVHQAHRARTRRHEMTRTADTGLSSGVNARGSHGPTALGLL